MNNSIILTEFKLRKIYKNRFFFNELSLNLQQRKNFKSCKKEVIDKKSKNERYGIGSVEEGINENDNYINYQFAKINQ